MRYVNIAIACGLFVSTPALAQSGTSAPEKETLKAQLQHVVIATEVCRSEADTIVGTIEAKAKESHGVPFFILNGPQGVQVFVRKETFADYFMLTCFPKKVLEDPVLNGAPDIAKEVPTL